MAPPQATTIRLALPKGRMQEEVFALLADAGIRVHTGARGYRPRLSIPGFETKILKPQNIVEMLHAGSRDLGFAGADWVEELDGGPARHGLGEGGPILELLDTGLDPVRLVAAAPLSLLENGRLPDRPLVVASEYERLTKAWIQRAGIRATFVRSYGATEVFPPEDADLIVDNAQTGLTLEANHLQVVGELMTSTTRLYAHPSVLEASARREAVDRFVLLLRSVLEARARVMIEVNVTADRLESVVEALPAMREPTIAPLHGTAGYAVKAAVRRTELTRLIPEIKARGGSDIVVTALSQIVP